jgi:hypothetical protein
MKSALSLIKHYESSMLQLKNEELLHFLINNIIKQGYFQNSNYDNFIFLTKSLKVQNGLLSNLENEYLLDLKVKELEENKREENRKSLENQNK